MFCFYSYYLIHIFILFSNNVIMFSSSYDIHIITGSAGYLGKELCHTILEQQPCLAAVSHSSSTMNEISNMKTNNGNILTRNKVIGLVRNNRLEDERLYWKTYDNIEVHDIDNLQECILEAKNLQDVKIFVYCVASNFKPSTLSSFK